MEIETLDGFFLNIECKSFAYFCDVIKGKDFIPFSLDFQKKERMIVFSGISGMPEIVLNGMLKQKKSHIEVKGEIKDTSGKDRPVSLRFCISLEKDGWFWWDDVNNFRKIENNKEYENTDDIGVGLTGAYSRYYWGCVTSRKNGVCIACPADNPRYFKISATKKFLQITYDFGLTPEIKKYPGIADFCFIVYQISPEWGFRSALKKYYSIYPQFFKKRTKKQGIWLPFADIRWIKKPSDFGIAFHEGPRNPFSVDRKHKVYSFVYHEPWTYWQKMSDEKPSYEKSIKVLKKNAKNGKGIAVAANLPEQKVASATIVSGIFDDKGKYVCKPMKEPWCHGVVFINSMEPEISGTKKYTQNRAQLAFEYYASFFKGRKDRPEGIYIDGSPDYAENYLNVSALNFRRQHFPYSSCPAVYDAKTLKIGLMNHYSNYAFLKYISDWIHQKGYLVMCNGSMRRQGFYNHLVDISGTEIKLDWGPAGAEKIWQGKHHQWLCFVRSWLYQKIYLLLILVEEKDLTEDFLEEAEKYFKIATFYGFFPSFFGGGFWQKPEIHDRYRNLFKKYIPVIKKISAAGWEPITEAKVSSPDIGIERYGDLSKKGKVYFTLLNKGDALQKIELKIPLRTEMTRIMVKSLLEPEELSEPRLKGGLLFLNLEIPPDNVKVIEIKRIIQ
ncbi:MAG: hypothetical protein N2115_02460 [bacterium]|nr:hypothetical protein [bacterium]